MCGLTRNGFIEPQVRGLRADELTCRPGSVHAHLAVSRWAAIHLGPPSPAASCGPPADSGGSPSNVRAAGQSLSTGRPLDLAPGGVYRAVPVAQNAGGLLHHRFTLTASPTSR